MRLSNTPHPVRRRRREANPPTRRRPLVLAATDRAPDIALHELCQALESTLAESSCAILLFAASEPRIQGVIAPNLPPPVQAALAGLEVRVSDDLCARANHRPAASLAADLARASPHAILAAMARDFGLNLWFAVPICHEERQMGIVALYRNDADPPADVEREAAAATAVAISRVAHGRRWPAADSLAAPDRAVFSNQHAHRLAEKIPAITYVQRVGVTTAITYVSPQVTPLLGWRPVEYAAHTDHWFAAVHPADQARVRAAVARATATGEPLDVEYRVIAREGRVAWMRDMAAPDEESHGAARLWHGVQIDITADKLAAAQLHQFAFYDSLTGLPNRRLCIDRLQEALNLPRRPDIALLFLDLDRFKVINDGIGHAAGDALLIAVAQRLAAHVAGHGSLARFGGDEFVAVLECSTFREVAELAGTLLEALRRPFFINGYDLIVEGTIGIATASPDLASPEALLRAADSALYRAKGDGGNVFALYDPRLDRQCPDRVAHEAELRRALERGEFQIDYQPVVDIETRGILAVEALLRWNHPERGLLQPGEFIPLADDTGVIVPLGLWVIEEACRQIRDWQNRYPIARSLQVSVNLSGRQLRQSSLASDVALALARTGLAPRHLALEIKEGDTLADSRAIAGALRELRRLGVKVTIDDFGKGWGALGSLTHFTIDDLKIDGSGVSNGGGRREADVVRALIGMAKALGLDVTAGAVETDEQLALFRELGCDRAQGRHLAPPLVVAEMEQLLQGVAAAP